MKNGEYKVIALGLYKTEALPRPKRDHVVSSREKCEQKKVLGRNIWQGRKIKNKVEETSDIDRSP